MTNFVCKTMNFVVKTEICAFNLMNFGQKFGQDFAGMMDLFLNRTIEKMADDVSRNHELFSKRGMLYSTHRRNFALKMRSFALKMRSFCIENEGFCRHSGTRATAMKVEAR